MVDKHLNNYKKRMTKYMIFYDYNTFYEGKIKNMRELESRRLDLFSAIADLKKLHNTDSIVITGVHKL